MPAKVCELERQVQGKGGIAVVVIVYMGGSSKRPMPGREVSLKFKWYCHVANKSMGASIWRWW